MPARHRCLCQSRPVIWLKGLYIQLQRGGLSVRRFFAALKKAGVGLVFASWAVLKWLVAFPPKAVHWLWTSLFWPTEPADEPLPERSLRKIANLQRLTDSPFAGPSWRERFQGGVMLCWRGVCRWIRIGRVHLRRAIWHGRIAFQKHTAWSLATVTGSLGILLMLIMQLMYSFQDLRAKEAPSPSPTYHTAAKTRIDPGLPQLRAVAPHESEELAQIDPFAPAQPDPSAMPPQRASQPVETPADPAALDTLPPLNPIPVHPDREPPREPEPFIDPLDNLPLYEPEQLPEPQPLREPAGNPFSPIPTLPTDPRPPAHPATEPPGGESPEFEPPLQEQQNPTQPVPGDRPPQIPSRMEPQPFIDPLDSLPLFPTEPDTNSSPANSNPSRPPSEPPRELVPEVTPLPPVSPPAQGEPTPSIDPLNNSPTPLPGLLPGGDPLPPVEDPPKAEPDPFFDPLDMLPPQSPPQEDRQPGPPPEFDPHAPPMPPVENPPNAEPNPFADPLDTLPPSSPLPQEPPPAADPLKREPVVPMGETVPPVELGIGFQRLPLERDERFLLESDAQYRKNILSREIGFDAWERSLDPTRKGPVAPRPYWERLSLDERRRLEQDLLSPPPRSSYEPIHQNPRGELSVEIAKTLPPRITAHEPLKYEIVVENLGREMIEHVDVDESLPPTHLLTDVNPAGHFENNLLRWRLRDLRPGEQRRLAVEVVPSRTGPIETATSVRPSARVATVTDVAAPMIRLRRSGYRTMALDESVVFTNHVQNLSGTAQQDVSIVEKVPEGYRVLQVEDGGRYDRRDHTITWNLASLAAGKTAKVSVRLQAESTGELVSRVKASTREGKAIPILARVHVELRRTGRLSLPDSDTPNHRVSSKRCAFCGGPCRCTVRCR